MDPQGWTHKIQECPPLVNSKPTTYGDCAAHRLLRTSSSADDELLQLFAEHREKQRQAFGGGWCWEGK